MKWKKNIFENDKRKNPKKNLESTKSMKNFSKSEISMKKEDQRLLECMQGKFMKYNS